MTAKAEPLGWSAYCDDCDWESEGYDAENIAERVAETHNEEYHSEEAT